MNQRKIDYINSLREKIQDPEKFKRDHRLEALGQYYGLGVISFILGVGLTIFREYFIDIAGNFGIIAGVLFITLSILIFTGKFLFQYLEQGSIRSIGVYDENGSISGIAKDVQDLMVELSVLKNLSNKKEDFERITKTINDTIDKTLTENYLRNKIELNFSKNALEESRRKEILFDFELLNIRINGELVRLRNSANLNLVIGTLVTLCALFALGLEVFKKDVIFSNTNEILVHYIPRISLIIFVEVFAFFFLKLYKAALDDIKYYNNEKTNIDFKVISLKTALTLNDPKLVQTMLDELIKTERNFRLGKGDSTVELEKLKNDKLNLNVLVDIIEKLKLK